MFREDKKNFGDLKVIILLFANLYDGRNARKYFMSKGFYLINSSTDRLVLYGSSKRFQEEMTNCPFDVYLGKIRNKRFYDRIYN